MHYASRYRKKGECAPSGGERGIPLEKMEAHAIDCVIH
jgi:hypothetical protein